MSLSLLSGRIEKTVSKQEGQEVKNTDRKAPMLQTY